ncbi:MAG: HTH domain-containing protein [Bacteroidales bacterium]
MQLRKNIDLLAYLDFLIRNHTTGSPGVLAKKLGVSKRSVHYYLAEIKEMGAPVKWNPIEETYIYEENVKLTIKIAVERLNNQQIQVPKL